MRANVRILYYEDCFDDELFIHNLGKLLLCIKMHMATPYSFCNNCFYKIYAHIPCERYRVHMDDWLKCPHTAYDL